MFENSNEFLIPLQGTPHLEGRIEVFETDKGVGFEVVIIHKESRKIWTPVKSGIALDHREAVELGRAALFEKIGGP